LHSHEVVCDCQLLQNEADVEAIADEWHSILQDCTSVCLSGDSHDCCEICEALVLQLKHCATAACDVNSCGACGRVAALISLHHVRCSQTQQRCCHGRYLSSSSTSASHPFTEQMSVDRVRSYLLSVFFPTPSDHGDGDDDGDDYEADEDEKDFDSDHSDDSIMMPSFSSDIPSSQPPTDESLGSVVPQGGAYDLPVLFGRGIDSATTMPSPVRPDDIHHTEPAAKSVGATEMSDPQLFISSEVPASTAGFPGGAMGFPSGPIRSVPVRVIPSGTAGFPGEPIHSVPVTSSQRPRGRIRYGTKSQLRQYASLWQNYADRARQDGTQTLHDLPVGGVILEDFRCVSHSVVSSVADSSENCFENKRIY